MRKNKFIYFLIFVGIFAIFMNMDNNSILENVKGIFNKTAETSTEIEIETNNNQFMGAEKLEEEIKQEEEEAKKKVEEEIQEKIAKDTVVIDAGHGGFDPGKVVEGNTDIYEKDINLEISLKLQKKLEEQGFNVVMTREDEEAVGESKEEDMNNRKEIINNSYGDVLVSIHQNSYTDKSVRGGQVFYFGDVSLNMVFAEFIHEELSEISQYERPLMPNSNYYILRETTIPSVIIECSFMTNPDDLALIRSSEYQDNVVLAITEGIVKFFDYEEPVETVLPTAELTTEQPTEVVNE